MSELKEQYLEMTPRDRATQLFLQHYQYVAQVAFHTAPTKCCQDDIVHDTFIQFVKNPEKWDLERDVRPLLRSITEKIALKYWRERSKTMPEFLAKLMEHIRIEISEEPEDDSTLDDRLSVLNLCMKKLTDRNQAIIKLFYFQNHPLNEIAVELGMNPGTLRKAICRIRDLLRRCIEETLHASGVAHE